MNDGQEVMAVVLRVTRQQLLGVLEARVKEVSE